MRPKLLLCCKVPEERVELSRRCRHGILSPACLPFHHSGGARNIPSLCLVRLRLCRDAYWAIWSIPSNFGSNRLSAHAT
jgi:hypothetical protein